MQEWREVRDPAGAAHRDFVDYLAAGVFKAALEGRGTVLARRVVGEAGDRGLAVQLLGGMLAHDVAGLPHGEGHPGDVWRQVGDKRRASIHDDDGYVGPGRQRGNRHRVWREDDAADDIHLFAGDEFLDDRLGDRAPGVLRVAKDELDRVALELALVLVVIEKGAPTHLLAQVGETAGEGGDESHLDGARLGVLHVNEACGDCHRANANKSIFPNLH